MADDFVGRIRFEDDSGQATQAAADNVRQMADKAVGEISRVDQAFKALGTGAKFAGTQLAGGGFSALGSGAVGALPFGGGGGGGGGGPLALPGAGSGAGVGPLLAIGGGGAPAAIGPGAQPLALPPGGGALNQQALIEAIEGIDYGTSTLPYLQAVSLAPYATALAGSAVRGVSAILPRGGYSYDPNNPQGGANFGLINSAVTLGKAGIGRAQDFGRRTGAAIGRGVDRAGAAIDRGLVATGGFGRGLAARAGTGIRLGAASAGAVGGFALAGGAIGVGAVAAPAFVGRALGQGQELQELGDLSRTLDDTPESINRVQLASERLGLTLSDLTGNVASLVEQWKLGSEEGELFANVLGLQGDEGTVGALERLQSLARGLDSQGRREFASGLGIDPALLARLADASTLSEIDPRFDQGDVEGGSEFRGEFTEFKQNVGGLLDIGGGSIRAGAGGILRRFNRLFAGDIAGFYASEGRSDAYLAEQQADEQARQDARLGARVAQSRLALGLAGGSPETNTPFGVRDTSGPGPNVNVFTQTTGNDFVERIYEVLQNYPYWSGLDGQVFDQ